MKKDRIAFAISLALGTLLIGGILQAVDFLYAGVQEKLFSNVNPDYEPNITLANNVILGCSLAIFFGIVVYIVMVWYITRMEKIKLQVQEEKIIDQDGSLNFRAFQYEISSSIKVLKDLFAYLIVIVVIAGMFSFLRFVWIFGRYRSSSQLFIEYYLTNVSSLIVGVSLYIALGFMISFLITTSMQKYTRLKIISTSYDEAMEKVVENFDRLMNEEENSKSTSKDQ
ncbi:MAG: hypothetical protein ACTSSH_01120 [Candidatus Heimdallarchaeota archaeon]